MRYLCSPQGEAVMHRCVTRRTLLAFDFDGTLAPIVARPESASAPISVERAMRRLCEAATVAIVSGRAVADIRRRIGFHPKYVVGNHGAEGLPGQPAGPGAHPAVAAWEAQLDAVADRLPPGTRLENKGQSLTLHYRMADHRDSARQVLESLAGTLVPAPRSSGGKCVINLMPPDAADKFDALLALQRAEHAPNLFFVGDDETDETAFRKALPGWITVRVGHDRRSAAAYCLNSQTEIVALIARLDALVRPPHPETNR